LADALDTRSSEAGSLRSRELRPNLYILADRERLFSEERLIAKLIGNGFGRDRRHGLAFGVSHFGPSVSPGVVGLRWLELFRSDLRERWWDNKIVVHIVRCMLRTHIVVAR